MSPYRRPTRTTPAREDQCYYLDAANNRTFTGSGFDGPGLDYHTGFNELEPTTFGTYRPEDNSLQFNNQLFDKMAIDLGHVPSGRGANSNLGYYFPESSGENSQHYVETARTTAEGSGFPPSGQYSWHTASPWTNAGSTLTMDASLNFTTSAPFWDGASSPSAYSASSGVTEMYIPPRIVDDPRQYEPAKLPIARDNSHHGRMKDQTASPTEGFRCREEGCRSEKVFRRAFERDRHEKIHGFIRYRCLECRSQGVNYTLPRQDKMQEHCRKKHGPSGVRLYEQYEVPR